MKKLAVLSLSTACLFGCHSPAGNVRSKRPTADTVNVSRTLGAASADGKLYLSVPLHESAGKDGPAEIRSLVTGEILNTIELKDLPLLFSPDDKSILSISSDGHLVRQSIENGRRQILAGGLPRGPYHFNLDRSICTAVTDKGGLVITDSGNVIGHIQVRGFDSFGSAWGKRSGQSIRVLRNGSISVRDMPIPLSEDQSHDRGPMHLHESHKNAGFDVIWLEDDHSLAQPTGDEDPPANHKDHSQKMMAIASEKNVLAYGFVPSRAEVYVLGAEGTTFYKLRAAPAGG